MTQKYLAALRKAKEHVEMFNGIAPAVVGNKLEVINGDEPEPWESERDRIDAEITAVEQLNPGSDVKSRALVFMTSLNYAPYIGEINID